MVNIEIQGIDKDALMKSLAEELPVLRAKIGLSQEDLSNMVGVSRQTYSAIETKKRKMSWNMYLALILIFDMNERTHDLLKAMDLFPEKLQRLFNTDSRATE